MAIELYGAEYDVEIDALRPKPKPEPRSIGVETRRRSTPRARKVDLANDERVITN